MQVCENTIINLSVCLLLPSIKVFYAVMQIEVAVLICADDTGKLLWTHEAAKKGE